MSTDGSRLHLCSSVLICANLWRGGQHVGLTSAAPRPMLARPRELETLVADMQPRIPSRLVRAWRVAFVRVEDHRLGASLAVARRELVPSLGTFGDRGRHEVVAMVEGLLTHAEAARADGRIDEGWQCHDAARRVAVFAMSDAEALAVAMALRAEAESKLGGWRRKAIAAQLRADGEAPTTDRHRLSTALQLRDEYHHNQYYRTRLVARQFKTIALYLGIAFVGMLVAHRLGAPLPGGDTPLTGAQLVPWTALFGLLGATFSVAFPLTRGGSDSRKIPEQVGGQAITLIRPLLGAAAGPVAYAFVRSGLFSAAAASEHTMLLVAFAAGFSERIILRAVGTVAGGEERAPSADGDSVPHKKKHVPKPSTLGAGAIVAPGTTPVATTSAGMATPSRMESVPPPQPSGP